MKTFCLILSMIIMYASCIPNVAPLSQLEAIDLMESPLPMPDFVSSMYPQPGTIVPSSGRLCVYIRESVIWEPGDDGELSTHIASSLELEIDGQQYTDLFMFSPLLLIPRYDEDDNYLGSHDGDMQICTQENDWIEGIHVVTIRTQSTSGKEYMYSWAFRVEDIPTAQTDRQPDAED